MADEQTAVSAKGEAELMAPEQDIDVSGVDQAAVAALYFAPPSAELYEQVFRSLTWDERFTATNRAAASGGATEYIYGLREATVLFNPGGTEMGAPPGLWLDVEKFIEWVRTTLGDQALADALRDDCAELTDYNEILDTIAYLLILRIGQYAPYQAEEEPAQEPEE